MNHSAATKIYRRKSDGKKYTIADQVDLTIFLLPVMESESPVTDGIVMHYMIFHHEFELIDILLFVTESE
jgi:hypothetical protein